MGKNSQPQKTGSSRILNGKYFRIFSAGGVVYRKIEGKICWLVRQTVASKDYPNTYWMLPKGWIDDTENDMPGPIASGKIKAGEDDLRAAALREVLEEGGIKAKIINKIGTLSFSYTDSRFGKTLKFVTFYLMEYIEDVPDGHDNETSEVLWLSYEKAYKKLSFEGEKQMLKKARNLLPL